MALGTSSPLGWRGCQSSKHFFDRNVDAIEVSDDFSMDELTRELDRENARIVISKDFRRFKKPVTIISGLQDNKEAPEITKKLKVKIGTGGTYKDGQIMLQGDHREITKSMLVSMGFAEDSIEVM